MAEQGPEQLDIWEPFKELFSEVGVAEAQRPQVGHRSLEAAGAEAPHPAPWVHQFLEEMAEGLELQGPHQVVAVDRPALGPAEASASLLSRPNGR